MLKVLDLLLHLSLDLLASFIDLRLRHNIVGGREDGGMGNFALRYLIHWIHIQNTVDLISEKLHTEEVLAGGSWEDIQHIPMYSEGSSGKVHIITDILHIHQGLNHIISVDFLTRAKRHHHILVVVW